jgi:hypothetical protein
MTRKQRLRKLALDTASDVAGEFCYYGRKEDEDLPLEALQEAFDTGAVTIDDVVDEFRKVVEENFGSRKPSNGI